MGQLRIAGSSGSVQFQATNTSSSQTLEAPDASGTIALLPTASGETGAYLARNASASAAERTAAGAITFSNNISVAGASAFTGLTTHASGVNITGGTAGPINAGLYATANQLIIKNKARGGIVFGNGTPTNYCAAVNGSLDPNTGFRVYSAPSVYSGAAGGTVSVGASFQTDFTQPATSAETISFMSAGNPNEQTLNGTEQITYFVAQSPDLVNDSSLASLYQFRADVNANTSQYAATNNYSFYARANDNTDSSKNNYQFYAAGGAPNYFKGVVRCGNPTSPSGGEIPDQNYKWTTQSSASNATRLTYGFLSVSAYDTNESTPLLTLNRLGSDEGDFIHFIEDGALKDTIRLDGSGGITYGTSDYRLKENIVDLPSATDTIKSLRPVNFNFTSHPGKTRPGFIAHEVSETLPVAVTGEKDATEAIGTLADYNGKVLETNVPEPDELEYTEEFTDEYGVSTQTVRTRTWTATGTRPVYQGVDQTKLIPLLTKALQEALERIEALENA